MKHILGISLRPVAHPRIGWCVDFGSLAILALAAVATGAAIALVVVDAVSRWIAP